MSFRDQWDKEIQLDADTQLVLVSGDKQGGQWVRAALADYTAADLERHRWLYVVNIAAKPEVITRLFTLPKMRSYPWPLALVRDHARIADWPSRKGVVAMRLQKLELREVRYFSDADSLKAFLLSLH